MRVNQKIFKAYDIRGIYPQEINEKTAYLIGRAFVKFLNKKKLNIAVGRDGRLSSPALFKSLVQGITDQGAQVVDIELSTSPMLYWAVAYHQYDGGIEISASHNPPQYNGFKMVREEAISISEDTGLKKIKTLTAAKLQSEKAKGKIIHKEILKDYANFNFRKTNTGALKPLKIVIDTANSVSGIVTPEIFKKTPCKIYHIFKKLDGSFPNHPPDPLVKENLKSLQKEVLKRKADLGVAFDGDGDRIMFVDEEGKIISADFITALITPLILKSDLGRKILYDVRSSNIVKETIKNCGGVPVIGRVGHSFIKEKMRKEKIIFAGEFSGHYYHQGHYFCEAPIFVLLKILGIISETKKSLSEILKPYQKYFHSGEINFKVKDKQRISEKLEKKYKLGKVLKIDGLRVDFKDWWFNVRPSHTEPMLRLVLEAKSKKLMEEKKKELQDLVTAS